MGRTPRRLPPRPRRLGALLLAGAAALAGCSGEDDSTGPPSLARLTLSVADAPVPFPAEDSAHLVYELLIENQGPVSVEVSGVEVGNEAGDLLADHEGEEIRPRMEAYNAARTTPRTSTAIVRAGELGVVFLWITVPPDATPARLRHLVTFTGDRQTRELGLDVDPEPAAPIALRAPVDGERWRVAGNANGTAHRRAVRFVGGAARLARRLATDWARVGADGTRFEGDPALLESWLAYGAEVRAVADGVVIASRDGVPENVPGETPPADAPLAGNHVLLDLGGGRGALYAHLIPGSLTVQAGDAVSRGDVLGRIGNSGDSTEPHLHFHVARVFDAASESTLDAAGLPFVLESFEILEGRPVAGARVLELPLDGAVLRLPSP